VPAQPKPPVFLLDTMSFIFRAYHAMLRSRPMTTRAGLPTAAVFVFVNMIKKLRQDFQPQYFAAVFDVSGEVFRDERARAMKPLRKWNGKTQSFDEVSYEGYKANRAATPEDLKRQIPYIRRALEALRIPILEAEGFEADDVIGTLAREAADEQHEVFIVSGDKDMMQLVTSTVKILNPQKDNLILDPAKVVEVLGVPPEKVIDVMALRGDAVDNIPGAPGIGDKGSVELIQEFGSVEAVLDRFSEVKRKSYRESLEQNRDAVLLSKELVTIDSHVPLALDLAAMKTQAPDIDACRELFTELEFTSMLRDLEPGPADSSPSVEIIEDPTDAQAAAFYAASRAAGFAFALDAAEPAPEEEEEAPQSMSLPRSRPTLPWAFVRIPPRPCVLRLRPNCVRCWKMRPCPSKRRTGSWRFMRWRRRASSCAARWMTPCCSRMRSTQRTPCSRWPMWPRATERLRRPPWPRAPRRCES
jgi:DNA polymerase-1